MDASPVIAAAAATPVPATAAAPPAAAAAPVSAPAAVAATPAPIPVTTIKNWFVVFDENGFSLKGNRAGDNSEVYF